MMDVTSSHETDSPIQVVQQAATNRYQHDPDWVTFYREVLGVDGIIDQMFPSFKERNEFEKSDAYAEIQQMLAKLREKSAQAKDGAEPTRVITVRLPQSLHEALRHEAHNHKTSMNKLCISKLLQVIADDLVPSDFERRDSSPSVRQVDRMPTSQVVPVQSVGTRPVVHATPAPVQPQPEAQTPPPHPYGNAMTGGRPF